MIEILISSTLSFNCLPEQQEVCCNSQHPLSKADKQSNQKLASERALNKNVIDSIKRLKIIADRYRNKRRRFQLRFNLISTIYSMEIAL